MIVDNLSMNIQKIQSTYNQFLSSNINQLSKNNAQVGFDSVSFGKKFPPLCHIKKYYNFNKQPTPQKGQYPLTASAGKIKHLREKYLNQKIRSQIENRTIPTHNLSKIVRLLSPYPSLMYELFGLNGKKCLLLQISDKLAKKVMNSLGLIPEYLLKLGTEKTSTGRGFLEQATAEKIKIFNNVAEKHPDVLILSYTTPNCKGSLPAHFMTPDALHNMNRKLKDFPETLKRIYTTTDKRGNTPAHHRFGYGQGAIAHTLGEHLSTMDTIYKTKNKYGEYCDDYLNKAEIYDGPFKKTWEFIVDNY